MNKITLGTLLSGALVAGAAWAEPAPEIPACAPANRIQSWSTIDDTHVYLSMQDKRRRYLVTFIGPCKEAKWATIMQLARGSVGKCLERGDDLIFRRLASEVGQACSIWDIVPAPLTAEEEAARQRAWNKPKPTEREQPPTF